MLGTASAMPVRDRTQSAQALQVHGRLFLIDCGEGTQYKMVRCRVPMMKLDSVFISHIHGDHVFGIFGLLSTLGMKGRTILPCTKMVGTDITLIYFQNILLYLHSDEGVTVNTLKLEGVDGWYYQ